MRQRVVLSIAQKAVFDRGFFRTAGGDCVKTCLINVKYWLATCQDERNIEHARSRGPRDHEDLNRNPSSVYRLFHY